jgi:RNA polymerase sigma-70 factor, ECF subfamily
MRPRLISRSSGRHLVGLADEDLMVRVGEGDAQAFEVIFDRHGDVAFSLAYRMCGRRAMAEDIVQEAFVSLWRTGAQYEPARGSVRSWVLGVVHNRAIDMFRRESVRAGRDVRDDAALRRLPAAESTELGAQRREDARELRTALVRLPDEQRRVIELAYFGGFTHTEIADMLETPVGTVKGRMRLGLHKMRDRLVAKEVAP